MKEATYRELAQRWMQGRRKGSNRKEWEHPQDVVILLKQVPGLPNPDETIGVAWLHDVLEDGIAAHFGERPIRVCARNLFVACIPTHVTNCVKHLTCGYDATEDKAAYLRRLAQALVEARIVKAADRIVNLQEGRYTFGNKWFCKYAGYTENGVLPFVRELDKPYGPWLTERLDEQIRIAKLLIAYRDDPQQEEAKT